jgi:DNA-directed RNA polymerase subunit RPC12/RpoP
MSYIESKYISLVSSRLDKFSQKSKDNYNFRCPYCGDSQKTKSKARGYLYSIRDTFNYKCHNCGKSISFKNFLKDIDSTLHDQFVIEKFKNSKEEIYKLKPEIKKEEKKNLKKYFNLPTILELNKEHFAKQYVEQRKIPEKFYNRLYFCEKFKEWTNSQKQTFKSLEHDEPRIIIPLIYNGKIFGFQGRSLSKKPKLKYITIILDDTFPKLYGFDEINWSKNVYVVEGPFDSMFIDNAIAMVGADLNVDSILNNNKIDYVFVYDNEKRNKEIVNRMEKVISDGHSIIIWPDDLKEKDINDMILSNLPVMEIVKNNTYKGLQAKAKFIGWKRV